ncbi:MAG: hypothetical protein ACOC35_08305, partial [Promethearchaeia archaeon]
MNNNYKNRLHSKKKVAKEEIKQCCDDPCIEKKDGDHVCLNCGCVVGRNLVGNERRAYTVEEVNK